MKLLDREYVQKICRQALEEDGLDYTTIAVVPEGTVTSAKFFCRENCVCAGLPVAAAVFAELSDECVFRERAGEGDACAPNTVLAEVSGPARAILTGERPALNFMQRLSGIATIARRYVDAVAENGPIILDTRKTTPGLRHLEKYAVRIGGAQNHRLRLDERMMIKDNHRYLAGLEGAGGIKRSVERCRNAYPGIEVEVEADTMADVREAVEAGADHILLDNMSNDEVREAVAFVNHRARLEASGGIKLERVRSLSKTGVDFISVGALTHSVPSVDIGLDM